MEKTHIETTAKEQLKPKDGEQKKAAVAEVPVKEVPVAEVPMKNAHITKCEQLAEQYSKVYPYETEFFITSDYQVFLNKSYAQNHQRTQKSGELVTIKIK